MYTAPVIATLLPSLAALLALTGPADAPSTADAAASAEADPATIDPASADAEEPAAAEVEAGPAPAAEAAPAAESAPAPVAAPRPPPRPSPTITATRTPRSGKIPPRYHRAPFSDDDYAGFLGQEVLMVFSSGYRVCGTLTAVDGDTVHYDDPKEGARRIARSMVTAVHEGSWECDRDSAVPKVEWALPGAATGLALAGLGLVFGVLEDAKAFGRPATYAVLGLPTTILAAPIAGAAGHSTARDLRVRGIPWARGVGWAAYGGAVLSVILWSVGHLGDAGDPADPSPLSVRGLAIAAGGLGALGTGLLAADALRSRREMMEVRRLDAKPATAGARELRIGATPLGYGMRLTGMGVGVSGRF